MDDDFIVPKDLLNPGIGWKGDARKGDARKGDRMSYQWQFLDMKQD